MSVSISTMRRNSAIVCSALLIALAPTCLAQTTAATEGELTHQQNETAGHRIGDVTSSLLQMQAQGKAAGAALPMLGATATLSWQRYQDSFKHKIPESFNRTVQSDGGK